MLNMASIPAPAASTSTEGNLELEGGRVVSLVWLAEQTAADEKFGGSFPSFEKRVLVRSAVPLAHGLPVWLGVATPALEEAVWLAREAAKAGAAGVLVMPPFFHRELDPAPWLRAFLDRSPTDAILYHFPRFAPPVPFGTLADHPRFVGLKDSSGSSENLVPFAAALPGKRRVPLA